MNVLVNPLDGAMGACGTISIFVAANDCNSDYLCVTSDLQILLLSVLSVVTEYYEL